MCKLVASYKTEPPGRRSMFIPRFWEDPDTLLRSTNPEAFAMIRWELLAQSEEVNFHPGPLHDKRHEQKENKCSLGIDHFLKSQLWREPYGHHVTDEETESGFKSQEAQRKFRNPGPQIQRPDSSPSTRSFTSPDFAVYGVFLSKLRLPSQVPRHLHCHFEFFSLR